MTLHELKRRMERFDIGREVAETLQDVSVQDAVIGLNQAQLKDGILATGGEITNVKANRTTYGIWWGEYRHRLGLQTTHYDLRVTGAWWNSIDVTKVTLQAFTIDAEQSKKSADIYGLFTPKVLGLTAESKGRLVKESFGPVLRGRITSKLGLKFT